MREFSHKDEPKFICLIQWQIGILARDNWWNDGGLHRLGQEGIDREYAKELIDAAPSGQIFDTGDIVQSAEEYVQKVDAIEREDEFQREHPELNKQTRKVPEFHTKETNQ
jgi:hypothetical protein